STAKGDSVKDLMEDPDFRVFQDAVYRLSMTLLNEGHASGIEYLKSLPEDLSKTKYNAITAACYYTNRPQATITIPYLVASQAKYPGRNDSPYVQSPYQILHFHE